MHVSIRLSRKNSCPALRSSVTVISPSGHIQLVSVVRYNSNRSTTSKFLDRKIYSQWYDIGRSYSFCRFSIKLCSLKLFFSTKILDINTNYFGIIFYSRQPICIYISYHFSKYKSITVFVCKIVFFLMHK